MKKGLAIAAFIVVLAVAAVLAAGTGWMTSQWNTVTTNTDGSPCTDLAGYRIHYGLVSRGAVSDPALFAYQYMADQHSLATSYTVTGLGDGRWYESVTAYDTAGNESFYSNEVYKDFNSSIPSAPVLAAPTGGSYV